MKKKITAVFLSILMLFTSLCLGSSAEVSVDVDSTAFDLNCKSAVLMEASTGRVLYEKNADEALPPASVTKIMTLLLVMEAIDSGVLKWDDTVTASAHASSMGGSQIFLKEGEQMSVEDMVKSVVIASANDAAVALAEQIAGSEEVFVARMNARAKELGMNSTVFENTNGLDDTAQNHVTSARDIAIMSRELIKHKKILEYSSLWTDTVRGGEFGLTNTNRLVRFYSGCTGLKTGSTSKAKFCISATAERNGMSLIAVIMASPSRDERNEAAKALLDWGYANYELYSSSPALPEALKVVGGTVDNCPISCDGFTAVVTKGKAGKVEVNTELPENLAAPIGQGDKVGSVKYMLDGKEIGETGVFSSKKIEKIGYFGVLEKIFLHFLIKI